MPHALDRGDRKLLIGAGVLLAILIVATTYLSPRERSAASAYPSSYSGDWNGAKGPYLLLQNLHYQVERWEESPTEISGKPSHEVLILAGPTQTPTAEDKLAIFEFLQKGGRIVASGGGGAQNFPHPPPPNPRHSV